jgi:tRNA pseudouridine38-40 synthase
VRVRLDVAYDGTHFSGWAAQPGRRTVAGVLLAELTRLLSERPPRPDSAGPGSSGLVRPEPGVPWPSGPIGLTVAGRTDAGVHATGQVCHVDVPARAWRRLGAGEEAAACAGTGAGNHSGAGLVRRLCGLLPPDVRVRAAMPVPASFDARFSALSRRYEYRVTDAPWGADPLAARYTLAWPRPLDLSALRAASAGLAGEHDFAAYCRRKEHATTVRAIQELDWRREPDGVLVATVEADAFCQAMVRSLVGAMLAAGDGRRPAGWPASLLSRRVRADEVVVAPPHGLTLVGVAYPTDPARYASRAAITRNLRLPA